MAASTSAVSGRIFISYRRDDTAYPAGWLFDRLADQFGHDQIFKDVDSIQLGDDFAEVITAAVASCNVLLAVIGKQWLTITDEQGRRRLDNPDDFVRLEIEAALARNVRVIPILVDGARMPPADQLPASIVKLARRNALDLSPNRFTSDTGRLLTVLERTLAESQSHDGRTQKAVQVLRPQSAADWEPPGAFLVRGGPALRYAVRSDVGLLEEGNEDSAYAGPHLLAVADGMGGHAAGEVASAVAISALTDLDGDLPANELHVALAEAVTRANQILRDMAAADPSLRDMGTTLTAMLWSGTRVALCHIGNSRAYRLSGGEFGQITHDHTLVQSLVDDGRISPDEAATHPQRLRLLRALDGSDGIEPDLSVYEARVGDRYLLCSDGLSGMVSELNLHRTLAGVAEPVDAVLQLIELAIRGGGPANITCIVADVVDRATAAQPPSEVPVLAGAAASVSGRPGKP